LGARTKLYACISSIPFLPSKLFSLAIFIQNITKSPFPSVGGYRCDPLRKSAYPTKYHQLFLKQFPNILIFVLKNENKTMNLKSVFELIFKCKSDVKLMLDLKGCQSRMITNQKNINRIETKKTQVVQCKSKM
jgi:hypothetical protein